jgi:branched-chain amino acid aminotransferase
MGGDGVEGQKAARGGKLVKLWVNGVLLPAEESRISPLDHGLLTGDGVFETMRIYREEAFGARRHLARLRRSAEGLGLRPPDDSVVRSAMQSVIEANHLVDGRIRVTLTGGVAPLSSVRGEGPPTLIVAAATMAPWQANIGVAVAPWPRNERGALAGIKSVSYAENVVALAWAAERGAGEAVFANTIGDLCEGTGTNVFCVLDGQLVTPPLASGCLAGVTRELVIELTGAREVNVPASRLAEATEAFVTSSTREVQPVRSVDGRQLSACPGPVTRTAAAAFSDLVERDLDP